MGEEKHFLVKSDQKVGRYAVAAKALLPGEVILQETPFAYGPKSEHPPMCLGCYKPVDCTYLCSSCHWPVCAEECELKPAHKNAECQVFQKAGVKFQALEDITSICYQYECITPLRVLLKKETDPKRWDNEISKMTSHTEERKSSTIWQFNQVNVVEYLRGPCKLDCFPEELIHLVCGILDVNAFEAHTPNGYSIRCLYPNLAILSHNCISNVTHSILPAGDEEYKVIVRSTVKVAVGEELFSSYTYFLWPTLLRRSYLKESKYFECTCKRCSDPTELGTHMGTLKCAKCDNGVILSEAPLDFEATWKCTHCEYSTKASAIRRIYEAIQMDIDNVDVNVFDPSQAIEARETLYRKYRSVLHPRNAYHTMLRLSLAQMYGKIEGYALEDLPDLLLERKLELCQQLLENLDVIEPGYTRTRGLILYELHAPTILLTRNLYKAGCIDTSQLRKKIEDAIKMLQEAADILTLEPEDCMECQVGHAALSAMNQLKENINELVNAEF